MTLVFWTRLPVEWKMTLFTKKCEGCNLKHREQGGEREKESNVSS